MPCLFTPLYLVDICYRFVLDQARSHDCPSTRRCAKTSDNMAGSYVPANEATQQLPETPADTVPQSSRKPLEGSGECVLMPAELGSSDPISLRKSANSAGSATSGDDGAARFAEVCTESVPPHPPHLAPPQLQHSPRTPPSATPLPADTAPATRCKGCASVHNLTSFNRSGSTSKRSPAVPAVGSACTAHTTLQNTIDAIELLHVVEADEVCQHSRPSSSSLKGGAAALLTVMHSTGPGRRTIMGTPTPPSDDSAHRKRAADPDTAERRQFGYPGGGTFLRASLAVQHAAHAPPPPCATMLHDKVLQAEGFRRNCTSAAPQGRSYLPLNASEHHLSDPLGHYDLEIGAPLSAPVSPGTLAKRAPAHLRPGAPLPDSDDDKAIRGRLNRADGGVGRRLTLEALELQFGKGLKDAAEALEMCPTTLKRACRRLGVRRWPRTPSAITEVLQEARESNMSSDAGKGFISLDSFDRGHAGLGGDESAPDRPELKAERATDDVLGLQDDLLELLDGDMLFCPGV
jgi:hypothetical protein